MVDSSPHSVSVRLRTPLPTQSCPDLHSFRATSPCGDSDCCVVPIKEIQWSDSLVSDIHESVRLDQFLKLCGIAGTGGQAKLLIQNGEVLVNGELETKRRRKLVGGDVVEFEGNNYPVEYPVSES